MSFEDEVNFFLNFLKLQNSSEKSCIFSPISMLNSLAMIYSGSNGNTCQEIANILGKDKTKEEIIDYYSNFIQRHKTINEDDEKNMELLQKQIYESMLLEAPTSAYRRDSPRRKRRRGSDSDESDESDKTLLPSLQLMIKKMREIVKNSDGSPASLLPLNSILEEMETKVKPKKDDRNVKFNFFATNKLIVDKEIKIFDSFNEIIKEKFDGEIRVLDFNEEKNEVVKLINQPVNQIPMEVMKSDDINNETKIILLNETHFIGRWNTPFIERSIETFYSKIPREIEFMQKQFFCNYVINEDWKCLGIPFNERNIWMFILLPNENNGLQNLINNLDYSLLIKSMMRDSDIDYVNATIPILEISGNYDLTKDFAKLGIKDLCDSSKSNLSQMIDQNYSGCCKNKAIHKTVIKLNEYGSGVCAIRRESRIAGIRAPKFKANYPFMYFIANIDKTEDEIIEDFYDQKLPTELLFAGTFC